MITTTTRIYGAATRIIVTTTRVQSTSVIIVTTTRVTSTSTMIHAATTMTVNIDVITSAYIGTGSSRTMSNMASYTRRRTMQIVTAKATIPERTTMGIEAGMMIGMAVSTIVRYPYARTAIKEVTTIVIAVNGEEPTASTPYYRTKEVVSSHQEDVLPVVQNATQVTQTMVVIDAIEVGRRIDTDEVIEVDLVGIVILLVVEVKLVCHLIRQIESLCLCTFETHCIGTHPGCHHKYCGENNFFHSFVVLNCLMVQRYAQKRQEQQGFSLIRGGITLKLNPFYPYNPRNNIRGGSRGCRPRAQGRWKDA